MGNTERSVTASSSVTQSSAAQERSVWVVRDKSVPASIHNEPRYSQSSQTREYTSTSYSPAPYGTYSTKYQSTSYNTGEPIRYGGAAHSTHNPLPLQYSSQQMPSNVLMPTSYSQPTHQVRHSSYQVQPMSTSSPLIVPARLPASFNEPIKESPLKRSYEEGMRFGSNLNKSMATIVTLEDKPATDKSTTWVTLPVDRADDTIQYKPRRAAAAAHSEVADLTEYSDVETANKNWKDLPKMMKTIREGPSAVPLHILVNEPGYFHATDDKGLDVTPFSMYYYDETAPNKTLLKNDVSRRRPATRVVSQKARRPPQIKEVEEVPISSRFNETDRLTVLSEPVQQPSVSYSAMAPDPRNESIPNRSRLIAVTPLQLDNTGSLTAVASDPYDEQRRSSIAIPSKVLQSVPNSHFSEARISQPLLQQSPLMPPVTTTSSYYHKVDTTYYASANASANDHGLIVQDDLSYEEERLIAQKEKKSRRRGNCCSGRNSNSQATQQTFRSEPVSADDNYTQPIPSARSHRLVQSDQLTEDMGSDTPPSIYNTGRRVTEPSLAFTTKSPLSSQQQLSTAEFNHIQRSYFVAPQKSNVKSDKQAVERNLYFDADENFVDPSSFPQGVASISTSYSSYPEIQYDAQVPNNPAVFYPARKNPKFFC